MGIDNHHEMPASGRYRRVTMIMMMMAKAPLPPPNCESSGSEHFPSDDHSSSSSPGDLSDLVNSYIERDLYLSGPDAFKPELDDDREDGEDHIGGDANAGAGDNVSNLDETRDVLEDLLILDEEDQERARIRRAVESILLEDRNSFSLHQQQQQGVNIKRKLMSRLRIRGFDAGLCKSRWAKSGRHPGGNHEYVDVNVDVGGKKHRYIIEVNLSGEFDIARATTTYSSLLGIFPTVYVGQLEEMKQVLRLMSRGIGESMKKMGLKVPPWRRNSYMQSKWLGPYKRTTNEVPAFQPIEVDRNRSVSRGFEMVLPVRDSNRGRCKDEFKGKDGYLADVLRGDVIDL